MQHPVRTIHPSCYLEADNSHQSQRGWVEKCLEKKQKWPSLIVRLEKPRWGGWRGQEISGDFSPSERKP